MLEHLAEIATIDPAIAGRAPNEVRLPPSENGRGASRCSGRGGSSRPIIVRFVPFVPGAVGGDNKSSEFQKY
jgi:hypothetical protein